MHLDKAALIKGDGKDCAVNGKSSRVASLLALCSIVAVSLAPSGSNAQDLPDHWQFSAALYVWLPDIGGHTTFPSDGGGGNTINVDISTIFDHLEMTGMGSFEMQKGRWGAFTDLVYLDVRGSKSRTRDLEIGGNPLPASVSADTDIGLQTVLWTVAGTYHVVASPEASLAVLAGARLASIDEKLTWEFSGDFGSLTPPPLNGNQGASVDQWDAIAGLKGQFRLGADHRWVVPYYLDVGTGDSDLTWQAMVGLGYSFGWGDVDAAWRYLDYHLKSEGPIKDQNFNGPAAGVQFRW